MIPAAPPSGLGAAIDRALDELEALIEAGDLTEARHRAFGMHIAAVIFVCVIGDPDTAERYFAAQTELWCRTARESRKKEPAA